MPSSPLTPRSGLEHVLATSRQRHPDGRASVLLGLRGGVALASVSARRNQVGALTSRVREVFALELPQVPRCAIGGSTAFIWAGPGHWLAMADGEDGAALQQRLRAALGDLAAVCDQSDGRTIIRVSGERARDTLAKGVPIDLHPEAFRASDVAVTTVGHIGAQLWQVDDTPTYELMIARSFAVSFWEWLTESAAEFGYLIASDGDG